MPDSVIVYGRMARLLEAHPTSSESMRKRWVSVYSGCNISPPLRKRWARKARRLFTPRDPLWLLGKEFRAASSKGHEQRLPFQFTELPSTSS